MVELYEILQNVSAASMLKFVVAICVIISGCCVFTVKLYKWFDKYRTLKDKIDNINELGEEHKSINGCIDALLGITKMQLRYSIVRACEDALDNKYISRGRLQSIKDLYEVYSAEPLNGNSYAADLVDEASELRHLIELNGIEARIEEYQRKFKEYDSIPPVVGGEEVDDL